MNDLSNSIIYKQLLRRHGRIQIPLLQRDYAQGRPTAEEVREEFLSALEIALKKAPNDPTLPLNLDFIYGSVEGKEDTRFLPLDGQQRLTTLFLLHWYLAWNDQKWEEFTQIFRANGHSRFTYRVRPSSNEFFDELVAYQPDILTEKVVEVSKLIEDQPWFVRSWRLDTTIQSVLVMLDAIHHRFSSSNGLFDRLVSENQPAITFQLLDLENFGLSDDLYIKMNARGKPLTPFETFKARYEQELKNQFEGEIFVIDTQKFTVAEYVARRMDTQWADLFWAYRDRKKNLYDDALMNVFRAVALVTRDPDGSSYLMDVEKLRSGTPSYADFHARGWLDKNFTITLIRLLDSWSSNSGNLTVMLPEQRYFNEENIFKKIVSVGSNLTYEEAVQFAAYTAFICEHYPELDINVFQEWMRVIFNLSVNTDYDRSSDMRRSIAGMLKLLDHSGDVLTHFATAEKPVTGFNEQQIEEERLKAELIRSDDGWRPLIDRGEGHGYFKGQIAFLLDFCGASEKWKNMGSIEWERNEHVSMQKRFESYLTKAEVMFDKNGLVRLGEYHWERALLCIGDYLLPKGSNHYFPVNSSTDPVSWKRVLRGTGFNAPKARKILHELFDRLTEEQPLQEQLDVIIKDSQGLEPWRTVFVALPAAIGYCWQRAIRRYSDERVYLLKKSQMNGAHAELFTFCLFHLLKNEKSLSPLVLQEYQSSYATYDEPYVLLTYNHQGHRLAFMVEFVDSCFKISVDQNSIQRFPEIQALLVDSLQFEEASGYFLKKLSGPEIYNALIELKEAFTTMAQ